MCLPRSSLGSDQVFVMFFLLSSASGYQRTGAGVGAGIFPFIVFLTLPQFLCPVVSGLYLLWDTLAVPKGLLPRWELEHG